VSRVNRRKKPLGHGSELTEAEELELCIGPLTEPGCFPSEAARRQAYFTHREALAALLPPDGRGWGWVTYEGGGFLPGERIIHAEKRISEKTSKPATIRDLPGKGRQLKHAGDRDRPGWEREP
jgi:hypothetical protein